MEEAVIAVIWAAIAAEWYVLAWVAATRRHAEAERAFARALERMGPPVEVWWPVASDEQLSPQGHEMTNAN